MSKSICLFSTYYTTPSPPAYLLYYLQQLCECYSKVIIITNNDYKKTYDFNLISNKVKLLQVKNEGMDFGMWKKALANISVHEYSELILCNDSCVLLDKLTSLINTPKYKASKAFGIFKSYEREEHIQSFFISLKGNAIKITSDFILSSQPENLGYNDIVNACEIGLSKHLKMSNIDLDAAYEYHDNKNPIFIHAIESIDEGCPFIKRKILGYLPGSMIKQHISREPKITHGDDIIIYAAKKFKHNSMAKVLLISGQKEQRTLAKDINIFRQLIKYRLYK